MVGVLSQARRVTPKRLPGILLGLLICTAALSAWVSPASANQVGNVSVDTCVGANGCTNTSTIRVDERYFGVLVHFTATSGLPIDGTISVQAPPGTVFSTSIVAQLQFNNASESVNSVTISDGGRKLVAVVPPYLGSLTTGTSASLVLGILDDKIQLPPVPGVWSPTVWTSSDPDQVTVSAAGSITTLPGLPASLVLEDDSRSATVGMPFDALQAKVFDSRGNALTGVPVGFTIPDPGDGPGGSFPSTGDFYLAETGAEGEASAPGITANHVAGRWRVIVSAGAAPSRQVDLANLPDKAASMTLDLSPSTVPADGATSATARVRLDDAFGNPVPGDAVTLGLEGTQIAVTDNGDGMYSGVLPAADAAGQFQVTAADASVSPTLTAARTLTRSALPASSIAVSLSRSSVRADGKATTIATVRLRNSLGAGVPGASVIVTSSGGQRVSAVADKGDGVYEAKVTAGTKVGQSVIKAAAGTLTAYAQLEQVASATGSRPVVKITGGPKGRVKTGKVTFRFKRLKGQGTFQCRFDAGRWQGCKSPVSYRPKPGRHIFRVRCVAPDGTAGKPAMRRFKTRFRSPALPVTARSSQDPRRGRGERR